MRLSGLERLIASWRTTLSSWIARRGGGLGERGERLAARFLKRAGYKIVARRYRTEFGEIDLIARDGEWLVFVEVKTRRSEEAGHPTDAVDFQKQKKLTRLALAYLKRTKQLDARVRFDVISIVWTAQGEPEISHYRHAFEATGEGMF